ncbi:MAG TPA: hypothetical protein VI306_05885 [Pyrinomonadaceae bacterium]
MRKQRILNRYFLAPLLVIFVLPGNSFAHDGPPFPIVVDQNIGPCVVSVWTDPDVGTGTFFIITSPLPGGSLPSDLKVEVAVQPVSGRLAEVSYPAERDPSRDNVQFRSLVQFDTQEMWRVRVKVQSAQGNGETTATVEATPPGLGRWDLLLYLGPFLAIGFLWFMAFMRKRRRSVAS